MKRLILISLLGIFTLLAAACSGGGPQGARPDSSGNLTILQEDSEGGNMKFSPNSIVLTVGQRVRLVLQNKGQKNHEFMIGRPVVYNSAGEPDGFKEDFFGPMADQVKAQTGMGAMLVMDGKVMQGMDMSGGNTAGMDHPGWMVMSNTGSEQTVIEFTVPESAVGEWEMGCFQDKGSHYDDGMRGKVVVVKP